MAVARADRGDPKEPQVKPSGMEDKAMTKKATVKFDDDLELKLTPELMAIYNQCLEWAGKLNLAVGGGISVKIWVLGMVAPTASFWWNGREIVKLSFRGYASICRSPLGQAPFEWIPVNVKRIWPEVFRPCLVELLAKETKRFEQLIERADNFDWNLTVK